MDIANAVNVSDKWGEKMSKLIRYDDAIERLGAHLMANAQIDWGGTASTDIEDWKELADMILNGVPTIDAVSEWIPCSERLPSEDELVLVSGKYIEYPCVISKGKYVHYWYSKGIVDMAWMPLPKPYEETDHE